MTDATATRLRFRDDCRAAGLSDAVIDEKADMLVRCDADLDARDAAPVGRLSLWVPGRIEVFGKHTDYAGGRSLLCAVERGFCVRVAPRNDRRVVVTDPSTGREVSTHIDPGVTAPDGHWSNYVVTVVRRIARNFPDARFGADIAFISDLPLAAGVSSSTALMIAIFGALSAVNRLAERQIWRRELNSAGALATYLGSVENGGTFGALEGDSGVGTLGGCQDQTAILCAERGRLVEYSWLPVQRQRVIPLPGSHVFIIGASGVVAEKSAGARDQYNRAALLVRHLLNAWNAQARTPERSLSEVMRTGNQAWQRLQSLALTTATDDYPAEALLNRLEQFMLETYSVIPGASTAFAKRDWSALGACAAISMQGAADWLGNQIPETMTLVREARAHGAIAASAFGAGFGGSVWTFVAADQAERFLDGWRTSYLGEFPAHAQHAMFFTTVAGPGARLWYDHPTEPRSLPPRKLHD